MSAVLNNVLYYSFQILYFGQISVIYARLHLAHDIAHCSNNHIGNGLGKKRIQKAWKMFDDSMRESYKAIGLLAGLLAAAISALFVAYGNHAVIRVLLLASLTSSVISAVSCMSMLSTVYLDPVIIEDNVKIYGVLYVIVLSGPSGWLNIAYFTFRLALLAIVWLGEGTAAKVVVTTLIGLRELLNTIVHIDFRSKNIALAKGNRHSAQEKKHESTTDPETGLDDSKATGQDEKIECVLSPQSASFTGYPYIEEEDSEHLAAQGKQLQSTPGPKTSPTPNQLDNPQGTYKYDNPVPKMSTNPIYNDAEYNRYLARF